MSSAVRNARGGKGTAPRTTVPVRLRPSELSFHPLTVERWADAEALFGPRGARIVESYPVEPAAGRTADAFAWTGLASAFRHAGFVEVARRSATRPIMRRVLRGPRGARAPRAGSRRAAAARAAGSRRAPRSGG